MVNIKFPAEILLEFRGPFNIPVQLKFWHNQKNYRIETALAIPFKNMHFLTTGTIKGTQLHPNEYCVYRNKKLFSSALFDYEHKKMTYGRSTEALKEVALSNITQDLFTIAWQMAINQGVPLPNTYVVDGKKFYPLPDIQLTESFEQLINKENHKVDYYKGGSGNRQFEIGVARELYCIPAVIVYYFKGNPYALKLKKATVQ